MKKPPSCALTTYASGRTRMDYSTSLMLWRAGFQAAGHEPLTFPSRARAEIFHLVDEFEFEAVFSSKLFKPTLANRVVDINIVINVRSL